MSSTTSIPVRRRLGLDRRKELGFGYVLATPQIIGYVAFGLIPIAQVLWMSLHSINPLTRVWQFTGLDNYSKLMVDPSFWKVLGNTGVFVVFLTVFGVATALALALLLNETSWVSKVFRSVYFVPALITLAAWSIVWRFILQPDGLADGMFFTLGLEPPGWITDPGWAMASMIVVQMFKNIGINVMLFLAALQTVSPELVESARLDGAGALRIFRSVTLPQISGAIIMVTMLMVVGAFKVFEQILLITNGGPAGSTAVLSFEIYQTAFVEGKTGEAAALAVILFVLVSVISIVIWQSRRRWVFHEQ